MTRKIRRWVFVKVLMFNVDLHWALKQVKARKRSVIRSYE